MEHILDFCLLMPGKKGWHDNVWKPVTDLEDMSKGQISVLLKGTYMYYNMYYPYDDLSLSVENRTKL